jgi:hypothetical protein
VAQPTRYRVAPNKHLRISEFSNLAKRNRKILVIENQYRGKRSNCGLTLPLSRTRAQRLQLDADGQICKILAPMREVQPQSYKVEQAKTELRLECFGFK